jgi:hypothetical protein
MGGGVIVLSGHFSGTNGDRDEESSGKWKASGKLFTVLASSIESVSLGTILMYVLYVEQA